MGYSSFEDFEVWKRACRLAVRLYELLRDCRDYGLKDQMTRAAVSIPSNIAEGYERDSVKKSIHFFSYIKRLSGRIENTILYRGQSRTHLKDRHAGARIGIQRTLLHAPWTHPILQKETQSLIPPS